MAERLKPIIFRYTADGGADLAGGKIYFYEAGTTTPKDTYADKGQAVTNDNPVILDARGEADIFIAGSYKVKVYDSNDNLIEEQDDVTEHPEQVEIGDPGTETAGINVNGVTYKTRFRINDIGGTYAAQFIVHRHSTTLQPLLLGARSNSNDSTHGVVTSGQALFSILASGWTGSHYDLFGESKFTVGTGAVSATSSPGKWTLALTPDGSNTLADVIVADSDKSVDFAGPINAAGLSVDANSTGNVSRYAMETALATATQYATLATIDLGSADSSDIFAQLLLTSGEGDDICTALINVYATQTTLIDSTESKIQVLSITDTTNVNHNDFFLTASATTKGTDITVSMQSKTAVKWHVQEISRRISDNVDATTPITYNNVATWSATDPTSGAAVAVTSDSAGKGTYVPVVAGGTTPGVGTYSDQQGEFWHSGPYVFVRIGLGWTAHTGTGNLEFTLPSVVGSKGYPLTFWIDGITFTGPHLQILAVETLGVCRLYQVTAAGVRTGVPMDAAGNIKIEGFYEKV